MSWPQKRRGRQAASGCRLGDPRLEGWETVSTFEDQTTAIAWRDQLRQSMGVGAECTAGPPARPVWGAAMCISSCRLSSGRARNEILDNLR